MPQTYDHRLYQHSGKLGFSPLLLAFVGIPLTIVLSLIYSYLVVYIPIAGWVTFLLLAGYAFAVSFTTAMLGKAGKCRNSGAMMAMGLVIGLVGLYFTWVFFMHALLGRFAAESSISVFELILNPLFLWSSILFVNENGWYSIKGLTPSGIVLWIFWGIEALVIVGAPILFAAMSINDEMYCENCNKWCNAASSKFRALPPTMADGSVSEINALSLASQPEMPQKEIPCVQEELLKCPDCSRTQGFRYKRLTINVDKEGNMKENSETVNGIVLAHGR